MILPLDLQIINTHPSEEPVTILKPRYRELSWDPFNVTEGIAFGNFVF